MDNDHAIEELTPDEYLRRRIRFLQNKVKEIRLEIKRSMDLLETYDINSMPNPNQLNIGLPPGKLDFSVTYWKPKVYQYLYDNPTAFVTEVILLGIDADKDYQKTKQDKIRAIKSISSSLFQLHKEKKIEQRSNEGRRGHKWIIADASMIELNKIFGQ